MAAPPSTAPPATTPETAPPKPVLTPGPALFQQGDHGPDVRVLQARLRQLEWYFGNVTDQYDAKTVTAVRGFQGKRGFPVTGAIDRRTLTRLTEMSHEPSRAELDNKPTDGTWTDAPLDPRCLTGRVLCIDKSSRTLRWMVDGELQRTFAVRFGSEYTPTREGSFSVNSKSANHVSSLYGSAMPYAMFFSRGQAVHYSSDFAARGYNGASHGCVNMRDKAGIAWLFEQVKVGDRVVVYWS